MNNKQPNVTWVQITYFDDECNDQWLQLRPDNDHPLVVTVKYEDCGLRFNKINSKKLIDWLIENCEDDK